MTPERSFSELVQAIIDNLQDIIRSEVRLARSELLVEAGKAKAAAPVLIVGIVATVFAALFLMWAIVYALALLMPVWAAALIVSALLAVVGVATLRSAIQRLRQIDPPQRTIATIKENLEWAKQQAK